VKFYAIVRPAGPGWKKIRNDAGVAPSPDSLPHALVGWMCGCAFVYAALFGAGSLLYGRVLQFVFWLAVLIASGIGVLRVLRGFWTSTTPEVQSLPLAVRSETVSSNR